MAYFTNMPTITYPVVINGDTKYVEARNILVRAKIIDFLKNTQSSYLDYTIRDGERPETMAYRIYGQSEYHWLILLFNEIIDPMFSWPLSTHDLNSAVDSKYAGKTLFIDMNTVEYENGGIMTSAKEQLWYEVGSTVTQGSSTGTVISWDPNLYKIVIDDAATGFTRSQGVGTPNAANDLKHVRSDGTILYASVGKVVDDNKYAVHHFEDADTKEVLDHHIKIMTGDNQVIDASLIYRYAVNSMEVVELPYRTAVAVSNYQYEIDRNDARRNIKVMRPDYIDLVIKDMRNVFSS